ncbi:alkaline phosphatase family protein [Paenibacillus thiaminolyticus]|uniref:alkaline phosphatase family protein n=1 Tax=Paenibacillus thiaminolyticus TaxID=49283 RepID=UPI001162CAC4|nr:alkaline phosphatase family protein [Paenibacillus thiaminolyticus]NGP59242.1 alkaline phosphatase family protein [Paenibacillus thiaminolyticus]
MRTKTSRLILLLCVLVIVPGCHKPEQKPKENRIQLHSKEENDSKKVIYLLIDSLMSQAIDRGIERNELPAFQFLTKHGQYYKNMVSSFPTMSVSIDSSLLTGTYPDGHRIPGLTWYSASEKTVVNYGTGPMEVMKHGVNPVLTDALLNLNGSHLNPRVPTIYEDLARRGQTAGSINGLIYRGTKKHTLTIPAWIQRPASLPREMEVTGPDLLALGALLNPFEDVANLRDGITGRMGFNNTYSVEAAKYLIRTNQLPDFLFVYLPDLDQKMHKHGPGERKGVEEADRHLRSLLEEFGSMEDALRQAVFVIAGDSGMTTILPARDNPVIELPSLLGDYRVLRAGEQVSDKTDLILAVNETMAYIYTNGKDKPLRTIAESLSSDSRIDLIAWKEHGWVHAVPGNMRQETRYRPDGPLIDTYGQAWAIEGDAKVMDLTIDSAGKTIRYGHYPDGLRRLSAALHSHEGEFLVVTAKPGYELADRSSPTHKGGGGHGGLRSEESLIPLLICGTDRKPEHLRIIDLKPFLLELLSREE